MIDAATRRQIGGLFDCRDLGTGRAEGSAGTGAGLAGGGEAAVESRFEALHAGTMTPLIGRDEEFELLLRRWRQAKEGEGQLVLLSGEPGIGKSRLIAALEERLRGEPHENLRYFCSPHHQDSALYPIITRWEQDLRFARGDTPQEKLHKLEAALIPGRELAGGRRADCRSTVSAGGRSLSDFRSQPTAQEGEDLRGADPTADEPRSPAARCSCCSKMPIGPMRVRLSCWTRRLAC